MVFPDSWPMAGERVWQHVQHLVRQVCRRLAPVAPLAGVAGAMVAVRLLPLSWLQASDAWFGRPGDTVLLVATAALVAAARFTLAPGATPGLAEAAPARAQAAAFLAPHQGLEQAIDSKLGEVIEDTESSAMAIITAIRQLFDNAQKVVNYLDSSSLRAGELGQEILDSVAYLGEIGQFLQRLPAKIERDLHSVAAVSQEIKAMSGLVESVQAVSMQSHLLAVNAAIEASRAGPAGAAFRIVANEMRMLAANSSNVAKDISDGLARARHVVLNGLAESMAESSQQLTEVSRSTIVIKKLHENFDDMSQYYKIRFAVVTKHNGDLARNIAEVLGQIQYQDVVRQQIERIREATLRRNDALEQAFGASGAGVAAADALPAELELVLHAFLAEEDRHLHSGRDAGAGTSDLRIELF